jgi:hypothetical protein
MERLLYGYSMNQQYGASRHMTNVFNIFTVMQIFNLICSRKIHDEINIFEGILKELDVYAAFLLAFA